jgi:hypothetical protein
MKKLLLSLSLMSAFFITGCASSNAAHSEAKGEVSGFLTTKWCAENGMFKDCRLESVVCGEGDCFKNWEWGDDYKMNLVLFVHNDGIYDLHIDHHSGVHMSHLIEEGINRDNVTIMGHIDGHEIEVTGYKAPPPPKKSFFKGCL